MNRENANSWEVGASQPQEAPAATNAVSRIADHAASCSADNSLAAVDIHDFSFAYLVDGASGQASHSVLSGINLHVERGAFCVIVGSTGCGKTTLLRSLKPELAPVGKACGSIHVFGFSVCGNGQNAAASENASSNDSLTPLQSAQLIGYVMQDPSAQIVCDTVWHELAFGLENIGMAPDEMRRRVAEVAHFFGIEPWVRSGVEELSGGQKQLVNLASVLALRPQLLLLDEPTAQLDPNAVKQFLFMLARVNRELGVTVVMATHAPEDVEFYATQRIDLDNPGSIGSFERAQAALASRHQGRAVVLREAETALQVNDLHFRFDRHAPWVLRDVELAVKCGSVHALVGGNGCGKTTLLRCLAGVIKPQRGRVRNALAASQAMLPQDPKALLVCDTVREELLEWAARCGYAESEALEMASRFGLRDRLAQHPFDLSGGQQQNLAMAKLLLANPQLLLLDEPTKGLDPTSCAALSRTVRSLADQGRTVVMVTHDLDFAFATADEVSMLFDGELACTEDVETFFANNLIYRPNRASRLFGLVERETPSADGLSYTKGAAALLEQRLDSPQSSAAAGTCKPAAYATRNNSSNIIELNLPVAPNESQRNQQSSANAINLGKKGERHGK